MVVYIDLIFITNLLIDGTLLWLTGWMRKIKTPWWRISLSALLGALYVIMMFVPGLTFMYTFLIKFGLSLIMLWIAFGFGSLQHYMRNMGAFYIINFAAAGGIIGIHYLLQNSSDLWSGIWYTTSGGLSFELKIGFWFMLIVFIIVVFWFKIVQSSKRKLDNRHVYFAEVKVNIGSEQVKCTGLLDTGNQLCDPLTRIPVMVMEASLWGDHLPASWRDKLAEGDADKLVMELGDESSFAWQDRLRLVPYRGVNRGSAFMLALKPDSVEICMDGKTTTSTRVLVGLDGGTLSSEKAYRAIIHPDLIHDGNPATDAVTTLATTSIPPIS
ncbi:sigma-E processing peptidase SpoIIGA [Paenibacillus macquariensis]|uniref:Stage II sporulation protein GA (Sporulation sigma-E factor processing peptidase) n=1 Tax=Paenibacillus macquariensis TaxID=948756 RepID=A0ABY1JLI9_9BACL|nr:sigma-E processing peptidase SpoIIGA [Paenibacillus macquariensis]MEC0090166.1 sigma-E processing peptidase SpoIIGA [Paenibacillus macquariensis]OAB30481.1 sigma-E processing peptidase SpoIIGA [Paenibacillus macquariensis subsp. macquariensis]SIQ38872.1 stage II sporulation protein GA (sporulation sigma-E factor processing peptidase) [Paenibacillus macquariensis]